MKSKRKKAKEQAARIKIISEKEALQQLGISSFRKMRKEKVPQFCTIMPYMEPEVACASLNKFPHFVNLMTDMVTYYRDIIGNVIQSDAEKSAQFNESCNLTLKALSQLLQQKRVKRKEREMIIEQMVRIARMQKSGIRESREWKAEIVKVFGAVAGVITGVAAMILGVHFGKD